jgi:hypothetical protein
MNIPSLFPYLLYFTTPDGFAYVIGSPYKKAGKRIACLPLPEEKERKRGFPACVSSVSSGKVNSAIFWRFLLFDLA